MNYGGKPLVSAEQAKLNLNSTTAEDAASDEALDSEAADGLRTWMVEAVPGVKQVELSSRLVGSPAIVVGHESASMRKMMTMVESGATPKLPEQRLEINAKHAIIKHLAAVVARQLFSNALISAGLLDDPRTMLADLNQ